MFSEDRVRRFWEKVIKTDRCWEWTAYKNPCGYGGFHAKIEGKRKCILAHRFSWLIHFGPIPKGLLILHKCDNPRCIRPDHLFIGDQKDNMTDSRDKRRHPRNANKYLPEGKTHHYFNVGKKITREIAFQIRKESGMQKVIAKQFGVDPSLVSLIKSNKIWRE